MTTSDTCDRHAASRAEIVVGMLGDAVRRWLDRREFAEFMQNNPDEAGLLSRDLNIDRSTLLEVARKGSGSAALLFRRLPLLGIDPEQLRRREPAVVQDLSRCCSLCTCKFRCARDMAREPHGKAWRSYCPNKATLDALRPAATEPVAA